MFFKHPLSLIHSSGSKFIPKHISLDACATRQVSSLVLSSSCLPLSLHVPPTKALSFLLLGGFGNSLMRRTIDQSAGGKLRDLNPEESWAILEDLALYDNKSWNDPWDFVKPVKEIALPQDVLSTSDRRLIELENQVQRLMEAHLALTQPTQVNKITTPCDICSGPHDTRHCMENPEQAFVEYASSRTDEAGVKNPKLGTHLVSSARSYQTIDPQCSSHPSNSINAIKAHFKKAAIHSNRSPRAANQIALSSRTCSQYGGTRIFYTQRAASGSSESVLSN
ncbi:hypothetical protein Tco_0756341 [Tanacetum coccineum]